MPSRCLAHYMSSHGMHCGSVLRTIGMQHAIMLQRILQHCRDAHSCSPIEQDQEHEDGEDEASNHNHCNERRTPRRAPPPNRLHHQHPLQHVEKRYECYDVSMHACHVAVCANG